MHRDPYEVLGVPRGASVDDVKRAYRKLAVALHPDKTGNDPEKTERFQRVQSAYENLTSPPAEPEAMFAFNIFGPNGNAFHRHPSRAQTRPPAQTISIPLDEIDVKYGCTRKLDFECVDACAECRGSGVLAGTEAACDMCAGRGVITVGDGIFAVLIGCANCHGRGRCAARCGACSGDGTVFRKRAYDIKCPVGVPDGHVVQLKGKGAYARQFDCHQDLHVVFQYAFTSRVRADGRDIHIDLPIDLADLMFGFKRVLHVYREQFLIETDGYIDPNMPHKLAGQGLPAMSGAGAPGDLFVHVRVTLPSALDARFESKLDTTTHDIKWTASVA
jgi:molecular chaperone DnaJ